MLSIGACVERGVDGALAITYVLEGDLERVRVPPPREPRRAERLWEHTCCEAFVRRDDGPGYDEFNFAPSGEWAAYSFQGYRRSMTPLIDAAFDPHISVSAIPGKLMLGAVIALPRLSAARLHLALSAVIEEVDGRLSYWALAHPDGKPDFHHAESFVLEIA